MQKHIVCPACHAVNRVPAEKPLLNAKCGACHGNLFDARPVELNLGNFRKHIERSDIPLLVDFWAPWCGPCKMMAPVFMQAATQLEPEVRLAKVNTEEEQSLAIQFGIRSIPTLMVFQQGRERARIAGAMDLANLVAWTRQQLK